MELPGSILSLDPKCRPLALVLRPSAGFQGSKHIKGIMSGVVDRSNKLAAFEFVASDVRGF
jgi:hypothetical protein